MVLEVVIAGEVRSNASFAPIEVEFSFHMIEHDFVDVVSVEAKGVDFDGNECELSNKEDEL